MGKRGPKPKGKVSIKWSPNFAYAIGLLATDGCVYENKKIVNLTSKDLEQIENFRRAVGVNNNITMKSRGGEFEKRYYLVQFGDVLFVDFLGSIGITPAKSKTLGKVLIPKEYFFDFLRGCFDGDGSIYAYWDPRWKSSYMFYLSFASASESHIKWLRSEIKEILGVSGHITMTKKGSTLQLKYAKADSLKIIQSMYYNKNVSCLSRKRLKIVRILAIVGRKLFSRKS